VIALKATQNDVLDALLPPLLHDDTALLTLQNGLGNEEMLAEGFGAARVLGGVCFVCLNRTGPGEVTNFKHGAIAIAEFQPGSGGRLERLAALFDKAGVSCAASSDLNDMLWRKLVWNIPFNGLCIAGGGITVDTILADPPLLELTRNLMNDVREGARVCGVTIPASFVGEQIAKTEVMGAYRPSSLVDFEQGRPVEVEAIWGEPLRRATHRGARLPYLSTLYALLRSITERKGTSPLFD
jgi:2-dehydropantoate 2-reductase